MLGGLQTVVQSLASGLQTEGHTVQVLTNRYPRSLASVEQINNVSIHRLIFLYPRGSYLRTRRVDLFMAGWYFLPVTLIRLARRLQAFAPQVVNVHYPTSQNLFVLLLRKRFAFRLVVSLHGYEVEGYDQASSTERWYLKQILRAADGVTACSKDLLTKAIQIEPLVEPKGTVIYNGIDLAQYEQLSLNLSDRSYILALGRFTKEKGFDLLLDAFARVCQQMPDLNLILAGEGEERSALEAQASRLALGNRLHFFGRATSEQVLTLLSACACVVIPSRRETFGLVALEAMAAGKPVIATRVGGLPEVVIGPENRLVDPIVDDLAAGLLDWYRGRAQTNGLANRQWSAQFSAQAMVDKYLDVYGQVN